jgi:hypothetical protein
MFNLEMIGLESGGTVGQYGLPKIGGWFKIWQRLCRWIV